MRAAAAVATVLAPLAAAPRGGWGISLRTPAGAWANSQPLEVQTVAADGAVSWTRGAYAAVAADGASANGTLTTPSGSTFFFADAFSAVTAAGFSVARRVTVLAAGAREVAFATQFSLPAPAALAAAPRELFMPGVAYQNASALPRGALAGDPRAAHILVREDRLPLPLAVAIFGGAGGGAARLAHARPDGSTLPNEDGTARIVDARLQFGSIGFLNAPELALVFQFPGSEGDRTYVGDRAGGWANRSHPLTPGFAHAYALDFAWDAAADGADTFAGAAQRAWRAAFAAAAPRAPAAPPPAQLYADGMAVLAAYVGRVRGVPTVPFEASLPRGLVIDDSSQMGFVGRATPAAALLLYDAVVAAPNAARAAAAADVLDFWAARAPTPCGVVRTWYDVLPAGGNITWRAEPAAYHGSLRIMSDGVKGLLDAHAVLPRAAWLAAALRFADFVVARQAADGSIATAWSPACEVLASDTRQTPHVIPVLTAAFAATGDARYRDAALRAGAFAASLFAGAFVYAGGAVDNPDVPDKEAGWLAAQAFIALYEMTGDAAYLAPAAQAATFAETFVYAWNVPIPCAQTPANAYPCARTTLGASIIATGQSGADNYMAIASHDFARLGAWLGDAHFSAVGALLAAATAQVTDWDGALGYAMRGLMSEAATLSARRGEGVADWLPWLTCNILYPLVQARANATASATSTARACPSASA